MCGFVAAFGDVNNLSVINATNSIKYRGPDESGFFSDNNKKIFLGHNRLSIMDPLNGKQPMVSDNGNLIMLFNGEIYNQDFLRERLKQKKIFLNSKSSDTEVLFYAFKIYREKLFSLLDGQFSICFIDIKKMEVYLARDIFGEKPLFYYIDDKRLVLGSQLNIFKYFSEIKIEINKLSLKKYFIHSFVPTPNTIYKNISKLEHAHFIKIDLGTLSYKKYKYFEPKIEKNLKSNKNDFINELECILDSSVKSRLLSDVDIGLFLSGGLDSSLVGHFAKQYIKEIKSFSISVSGNNYDERLSYSFMSSFFKMNNYELKLDQDIFKKRGREIFQMLDEPIGAPTYLPMFLLSEYASKKIKTVLTGDGADEIFGGYDVHEYGNIINFINKTNVNKIASYTSIFFKKISKILNQNNLAFKFHRFSNGINKSKDIQNAHFLSTIPIDEINDYFHYKNEPEELLEDVMNFNKNYNAVSYHDKNLLYFVNFYIPDLICSRSDRGGMYNSLEIRSPFLNKKILEFMLSIPQQYSFLTTGKKILKEIAQKKIHSRFKKLKKGGFTYPMDEWIEKENNHEVYLGKYLSLQKYFDIYNSKKIEMRNYLHCIQILKNFIK